MNHDAIAFAALIVGAASLVFGIFIYLSLRRLMEVSAPERNRAHNQTMADLANVKREVALLTETVSRFRTQSLAGITDSIAEQERSLRENLHKDVSKEVSALSQEFDRALKNVVERFDRRHTELLKDLEAVSEIAAIKQDLHRLAADVAEAFEKLPGGSPDMSAYARASVLDRFIASLEDPEDRRKCLLTSLDSVLDIPALGKLAVAYPSANSWLMLKELADHGVVSDIAGWALVAGAESARAEAQLDLAESLYQSARLSFAIGGEEDHEGLYFVTRGLANVLSLSGREEVASALNMECEPHIEFLRRNPPAEPAKACHSLADFYLQEGRNACAAILYLQVLKVAEMVGGYDAHADRAWNGFSRAVRAVVLNDKTTGLSSEAEGRETFKYFLADTAEFLSQGLNRPDSLISEDSEKEGILLCILRLCEREKDANRALATIVALMNQVESARVSKDHKSFLASEVLYALDDLGLSRKAVGLPILKQLVEIFSRSGNFSKAASAGAKLVDVSLDLFGDASLETVAPIELLARVYRSMERFDLAEECYRQILEIQYKVYPAEHENMIDVLLNLAEACLIQKDEGECEIFMESAAEMCIHLLVEAQEDSEPEDVREERRRRALLINERIDRLKRQLPARAS
ncbi:MAG: tetratricopeptide repeat protein [Candidatus Obscuribacter sp.]|nr:tetratricopeptide repeat protein [Candidatus Melainabacteria bacterium]MDX1990385.1 tetratricopeptide repeat protein [Candidatus Obscuribacter sp.]